MDWDWLKSNAANLSAAEVRRRLDVEFVLSTYGVQLQERGSKRTALCPFHNDHNPSFDVYERNGVKRVDCAPCGKDGDVIDVIQWFENCNFATAMTKANELLRRQTESNFEPVVIETRERIPQSTIDKVVADGVNGDILKFHELATKREWPIDVAWVRKTFNVGVIGDEIIIPHKDANNEWCGYKIRTDKAKYAGTGSRFLELYANWLDQGRASVIVTEGEPDTWAVMQNVGDRYDVLGLQSGAGNRPPHTETFRDRHVILAFDGDDAGRAATKRWIEALSGIAASLSVVPLPDGYDMCMVADIGRAIDEAKALLPYTGSVTMTGGIFVRARTNAPEEPISNWGLVPSKELKSDEGGVAYEARVTPTNQTVLITSDDLSSSTKMHGWAQHYGLGWRGTDKDARDILIWLESQGPFLAPGKMTRVIGLHENHFVLPDETIGKDKWIYVPRPGIVTSHIDFTIRPEWQRTIRPLFDLHLPAVTNPVLAWLAATYVRSLLDEFPILAVTGGSGVGKTTFIKTITTAVTGGTIGGKDGISLADTTKHAITENVGATNAIPVWFDEYRASIKPDTRDALHNSLLAAYIGQTTSKGSVTSRGLGVTNWEHNAPIIISGENTFTETAHVERMVLVSIPQVGRNVQALTALRSQLPSGLPGAFLHWLMAQDLNSIKVSLYKSDLPPRVNQNLSVLKLGWALLSEFLSDMQIVQLDQPDFSLVINEAKLAQTEEPVLESIRWAVESAGSLYETVTVLTPDYVYVRVESLVAVVTRDNRFALPGNSKAIRRLLVEKYNGIEVREKFPNSGFSTPTRFVRLPVSVLEY